MVRNSTNLGAKLKKGKTLGKKKKKERKALFKIKRRTSSC
jgi:hypothetical protein